MKYFQHEVRFVHFASTGLPTYQIIKVAKVNQLNMMNMTRRQFPCVLENALVHIRELSGLSFAIKRIGPPCWTFVNITTCYLLRFTLLQNYLSPLLSVLAENTLLKTAYHFLLLLIGFDTPTYRKDYDRSPILVGHQDSFLAPLPGSVAPLVGGIW
mgnify:CR=1 FL=1